MPGIIFAARRLLCNIVIVSLFPTLVESIKYFYFRRFNDYTIVFISEIVILSTIVLEISETVSKVPTVVTQDFINK